MAYRSFVAQVAVRRRGRVVGGVFALLAAGALGWMAVSFAQGTLVPRLGQYWSGVSETYRRAQWANTVAAAAWVAGAASLSVWLVAFSLRRAFGLPGQPRSAARTAFFVVRILAAIPFLIWLGLWSADEMGLRRKTGAPFIALGQGLLVCLAFAYDVPRLVRNARTALRSRLPLLRVPRRSLAELPPNGAVRTFGVVARGSEALSGPLDEEVVVHYREERPLPLPDPGVELLPPELQERTKRLHAVSFLLTHAGQQAFVEVEPDRLVVEGDEVAGQTYRELTVKVGETVQVVGQVLSGGGGAGGYRSGPARLGAGDGSLLLVKGESVMHRRLLVAGVIELLAAVGLLACVLGLVGFWLYAGRVASQAMR